MKTPTPQRITSHRAPAAAILAGVIGTIALCDLFAASVQAQER